METFATFSTSAAEQKDTRRILGDFLALEQIRVIRSLLVVRCGMLAVAAAIAGVFAHGLSYLVRVLPVVLCLIPPVWAWIAEIRVHKRLSSRLNAVTLRKTNQSAGSAADS